MEIEGKGKAEQSTNTILRELNRKKIKKLLHDAKRRQSKWIFIVCWADCEHNIDFTKPKVKYGVKERH